MSDAASQKAIAEALFRLEPLRDVPEAAVRELLELTTVVHFDTNQAVFRQGDPLSEDAWLLLSGRMSVRVASGSEQRAMTDVWPGEIIGEAALYARGQTRSATVLTTVPSVALRIPRKALLDHDDQPAIVALEIHLLESLARRLRSTNTVLQRVVAEQRSGVHPPSPAAAPAAPSAAAPGAPKPAAAPRPARPAPPERLTLAQRLARWFATAD